MPEAFSLGPFVLPTLRLAALAAAGLAAWVFARGARRAGLDGAGNLAERAPLVGLVGARLGFALFAWPAYASEPWTLLYLWQPGYSFAAGLVAAGLYLAWVVWRTPGARAPLLAAAGRGLAAALLVYGGAWVLRGVDAGGERLRVGEVVPEAALSDLAGRPVAMSELRGQVVVLNFWATWCPPCRREMPLLESVQRSYAERGVTVVGVAVGEGRAQVAPVVEARGVTYPIWLGGADSTVALHRRFGGVGLPLTAFVDQRGVLRYLQVGELSRGLLVSRLEALLP